MHGSSFPDVASLIVLKSTCWRTSLKMVIRGSLWSSCLWQKASDCHQDFSQGDTPVATPCFTLAFIFQSKEVDLGTCLPSSLSYIPTPGVLINTGSLTSWAVQSLVMQAEQTESISAILAESQTFVVSYCFEVKHTVIAKYNKDPHTQRQNNKLPWKIP